MPNPVKYKSVGVSIEAYDKLVYIAEKEDRAIGRQLSRMIDEAHDEIQARENARQSYRPAAVGIGGIASVIED